MKKHILSTVISSLLFGATASYAENLQFQFRIPLKTQLSNWSGVEPIYHPWVNIGSHYNCANWSPLADTIDFGKDFTQSRDCKQNQERNIEIRELDSFSGAVKTVRNEQENRSVTEIESQSAIGTYQNWVSHDSTFTDWADKDAAHSFSTWTPDPIAQTANFIQSRNYKQPQVRHEQHREIDTVTGDVKNIGEPILRTQDDIRSENRSVTVNWTAWEDTKRDGFGDWLPVEYTETADFKQSRVYGQHQIRDRIYDTSGDELKRIGESRVVSPLYEDRSVSVTASNWVDTTRIDYSNWTPAATTQIAGFSQSRTYTQNQERTWSYKSGGEELKTRLETRAVSNKSETQSVLVTWSAWVNKGAHYDCGDWSPATNAIGYGEDFAQTRTCKQDQTRNRIYSVAGTAINTVAEAQTINETESQTVTGVGKWEPTTSTFTNWANSSLPYDYSPWSPKYGDQTSDYARTQTYKRDKTRKEQKREIDIISGQIRNVGAPIVENQTVIDMIQNPVKVAASNWENTATSAHTAWSPAATTQTANFTQTRSYTQAQSRTWTHKVATTTIHSRVETQNLTGQTESRTVTVSWTNWANSGVANNCGAWSPATNTINWGQAFTQTRSCSQLQNRNRNYSSVETVQESQVISVTQSQESSGTKDSIVSQTYGAWSNWTNSGDVYGCSSWSPEPSTVCSGSTFTQARTCSQNQIRNRSVTAVWASGATSSAGTESGVQTISAGQNQSSSGTKNCWAPAASELTAWSTYSTDYSTWSPAATTQSSNFNQTREVTAYQEQYEQKREYHSGTGTYRNVGTPVRTTRAVSGGTESRTVVVSNSGWINSGSTYNCGGYSPDPSTVSSGQVYTQYGSCSQNQIAYYTYSVNGTHLGTYQYSSRVQSLSVTQTAIGTKPTTECKVANLDQNSGPLYSWVDLTDQGYAIKATILTYNNVSVPLEDGKYLYTKGQYRGMLGGGMLLDTPYL